MRAHLGTRIFAGAIASTLMAGGSVVLAGSAAPAAATVEPVSSLTPVAAVDPPLPQPASADPLPTVQINGVVWDQVIVGNTVYVGGEFTRARPAGAAPGVNETPRNNMLAYNLTTGELIPSFNPDLNAQVVDLAVTPDKSKLVAVGAFTTVGGQPRSRVAVFDLPAGTLSTSAVPAINGGVETVTATNSTIYLGGYFSSVNGGARARVAAVRTSNGALLPFRPTVDDGNVQSMVVAPDEASIVISGNFTTVEGSTNPGYGLARLDAVSGAMLPLPVNSEVRDAGTNSGILRLKSDGERFYGVGWHYGRGGNVEGYFAANWSDGTLAMIQDCHGDHYDIEPIGDVVYTASHSHYCGNSGGFPQTAPGTNRHAGAWTRDVRGTNKGDIYDYPDHPGTPRPEILNFFPNFPNGSYTSSAQATWTVTGNSDYVLFGGEFPRVAGTTNQQGLARFATRPSAPNKRGPRLIAPTWVPKLRSYVPGTVRVQWDPNWDEDDATLRYQVFRGTMSNMVYETTETARFWESSSLVFNDTGLTPGSVVQYRVRALDPAGNSASSDWVSVTVASTGTLDDYASKVLADGATKYWRLNEPSGATVNDLVGNDNPTAGTGVTRNVAGALLNSTDRASSFNGTTSGRVISTQQFGAGTNSSGPQVFSVEAWFKTSSTAGGKIVSYGNSATGTSGTYDRDLYLDSSRRVSFSLRGRTRLVLRTETPYNDNQWHHAVGTFSAAKGAALYVDGKLVTSSTTLPAVREFKGYWRAGGDGTASGAQNLNGSIDEVAIYDRVLTPVEVNKHWVASGRPSALPNQLPEAKFTSVADKLVVDFDASASSDPDGSLTTYTWDFGDGTSGTGVSPQHTYAAAGTYQVQLTVTDDGNATASVTHEVTVTAPVPGLVAEDAFERAVTGGWGDADEGGPWTVRGAASNFSVSGGAGNLRFPAGTSLYADLLGVSSDSVDLTAEFSVDKVAEGTYVVLVGRQVGSDLYYARVRIQADGSARLYLLQNYNAVGTSLLVPNLTIVPGDKYKLRLRVTGTSPTTVSGKLWKSGLPEPADWQRSATNTFASLQVPGRIGVQGFLPSGAAALAPVTVSFHSLRAVDPALAPNSPPKASFGFTPNALAVSFDGGASSDPDGPLASYAWDFGDGTTGSGVSPSHEYAASGTYPVQLTVTDAGGATDSVTKQVSVTANNQLPQADFAFTPAGLAVDFDGSASSDPDGTIASYAWQFGDGSTGTGATPRHVYGAAGTYPVTLTVTDSSGGTSSQTRDVTVAPEVLAMDDFVRTSTGSWGTADIGGPWTTTGPSTRFSVSGGDARMQLPAGQSLYADLLDVSSQRSRVTAEFSVDKVADGTYVAVVGRQIGADRYVGRLRLQADGQARLYLLQNFNAVGSSLLIPGLTIVPGEKYTMTIEVSGVSPTTVSGKVWKSSDPEPVAWQRSATNDFAALQNPGRVGLFSFLPGAASALAPVTVTFHNVLVTRPPA